MSGSGRTVIDTGATLNLIDVSGVLLANRTLENGGTVLFTGASIAYCPKTRTLQKRAISWKTCHPSPAPLGTETDGIRRALQVLLAV